jgi:HSP20 family protein
MTETTSTTAAKNHGVEETRNGNYVTPRVDIIETETELLLYADVPGVRPEDVDLRYENGQLIVRGKTQKPQVKGNLIYAEYEVGDYYRVFAVHETIDASKIDAEFKNGVLIIHLPKQEKVKPKQVQVRTS